MRYLHRSWAVVDLDALTHNARVLKDLTPDHCLFAAVVKADGYGHGDEMVGKTLAPLADWFAVSNLAEGISLRRAGITQPILLLGACPPEEADRLVGNRLTPAIYSLEQARALDKALGSPAEKLVVHIKADTGMGRIGFGVSGEDAERARAEIVQVSHLANLAIGGIFTHFAVSDEGSEASRAYTAGQIGAFTTLCKALEDSGLPIPLRHACNGAGVVNYPEAHFDMVRPGTPLYGITPGELFGPKVDLRPVMEWYTTVTMVKTIPAGQALSYGCTFIAPREMRVATLAVGYADGYRRTLSNCGRMLLHGKEVPVVGRVCMDQLIVDVTHVAEAKMGDVVTIVGQDGERRLTFDDMAALCGAAPFELCCNVAKRVPRIYRKDGKEFAIGETVTHLTTGE